MVKIPPHQNVFTNNLPFHPSFLKLDKLHQFDIGFPDGFKLDDSGPSFCFVKNVIFYVNLFLKQTHSKHLI